MSNVIRILLTAKWNPRAFDCWGSPDGATWAITSYRFPPDLVAAQIIKTIFNMDLVRAAQHYDGEGIQAGLDVNTTILYHKLMKPNQYQYQGALKAILCATIWPAAR